ncbi:MAG: hypothetical protein K2X03_03500 [Bryobacteraceae bacterium]|nr:hypothetical protein [Bryobacteraceae bacterium]
MTSIRLSLLLVSLALWAQPPSAKVDLSPRLRAWQQEIEARGGGSLLPVRVFVQMKAGVPTYILPDDAPQRPVLARFFSDPNFRAQFVRTHAVSIHEGALAFIVLNMDRMKDMGGDEETLLSHEFGHAWLHARGLRAPTIPPGQAACQAIHVGDIVQHLLIREEQSQRGFDFRPGWIRDLATAASQLRTQKPETQPTADPCLRLERLALLVDVEAGLTDGDWPGRPEFLARLPAGDPRLAEMAHRLVRILRAYNLNDPIEYYLALSTVFGASHLLFQPPNGTP